MQKYRRLLEYARPHWRFFVFIFFLTIAASGLADASLEVVARDVVTASAQ